jgi:ligand-binding sensor domain-containing protein
MSSKTWKISILLPALLLPAMVLAQQSATPEFVVGPLPSAEERLAQQNNLQFQHFTLEHGLSHNQVIRILQDARGFMWFGTSGGLNRFDGYEFRTYLHDQRDPHSLSHNTVRSMIEDRNGILWVATWEGFSAPDKNDTTWQRKTIPLQTHSP